MKAFEHDVEFSLKVHIQGPWEGYSGLLEALESHLGALEGSKWVLRGVLEGLWGGLEGVQRRTKSCQEPS